jgi:hypothetical protein
MTRRCAVIAAAAASLLTVAPACSSGHPARPANSPAPSADPATHSRPISTPPTSGASSSRTTPAPSDPRLAIQQAWTKFWSVNTRLHAIPPRNIESAIKSVAVDPILGQMRTELSLFASTHITNYGYVVNHPYETTLNDAYSAVVKDCMDQSHFGSMTTTGVKKTIGVARDNTTAALVKGADGVWRVKNIVYLLDVKC